MAHSLRNLTLALIVSIMAATSVPAQVSPDVTRKITFTVFSAEPVEAVAYEPKPGASPVALAFYPTARSPVCTYQGYEVIRFANSGTGEIVAEARLPAGLEQALFIFTLREPVRPGLRRYDVRVIDEGVARQPPGTLTVLNLSGLELTGSIDQRPVTLQEGLNAPVRVGDSVAVELRTAFNGRSYRSHADTLPRGKTGRVLLLLLPPYRRGSLEVQSRVLIDPASGQDVKLDR